MERGDTFMLEDEDGEGEHLHVLITSPSKSGEVVTVSISTRRPRSEALVCLYPGEHPFITRESICPYRFARIREVQAIEEALRNGWARSKEKATGNLVSKLTAGLRDSDFTPPGVLHFYLSVRE